MRLSANCMDHAFAFPSEAGPHFTSSGGMEGWVDPVGWLHTYIVYTSEDGYPSKYSPGPMLINFVYQKNVFNHYTMQPTWVSE